MIDHRAPCTGMPCTCGAKARAAARRNPPMESAPIQANLTPERLGIAHSGHCDNGAAWRWDCDACNPLTSLPPSTPDAHTAWNEGYDAAIEEHGLKDYGLARNPYPAPARTEESFADRMARKSIEALHAKHFGDT